MSADERQNNPLDEIPSSLSQEELSPSQDPGRSPMASSGVPAVASGGTKNIFVIAIFVIVAGIMLFNIFSGDDEVQKTEDKTGQVAQTGADLVPPPSDPVPPAPPVPPPPPPPPPPSGDFTETPSGQTDAPVQEPAKKGLMLPPERRKAGVLVSGGDTAISGFLEGGAEGSGGSDKLEDTTAAQVKASKAGEPINMIAQGKMIDAILETAINSDLSGTLRAVVSRDVYAEAGKRILIPKGSRLIGSYDVSVKRGQSRIFIVWNRVIRPDGIDIIITSPGSDRLGRAGVEGHVDDKYLEVFSNAILFSSMTVAFAFAAESAVDSEGLTERENTSGSVTTAGKPSDVAVVEAVDDFGDVVKKVAQEVVDLRPTITIDQGTRMKVFVNKDLKFPGVIDSEVVFIK